MGPMSRILKKPVTIHGPKATLRWAAKDVFWELAFVKPNRIFKSWFKGYFVPHEVQYNLRMEVSAGRVNGHFDLTYQADRGDTLSQQFVTGTPQTGSLKADITAQQMQAELSKAMRRIPLEGVEAK